MPPKKRQRLYPVPSVSQSSRALMEESEVEIRRERDRNRYRIQRQNENEETLELRRAERRERYKRARRSESEDSHSDRLFRNRLRTYSERLTETPEQRENRRRIHRNEVADSRSVLTTEQQNLRRDNERNRAEYLRARESEEQRQARLNLERNRRRHQRANNRGTAGTSASERHEDGNEIHASENVTASDHNNEDDARTISREWLRDRMSIPRRSLWPFFKNAGFNYIPNYEFSKHSQIEIGKMDVICNFCGAQKWKGESRGMCCKEGKVSLPLVAQPPEYLCSLMDPHSANPLANGFLKKIRKYNAAFQMTSFGATKIVHFNNFETTFKVQGQVYHLISSILPPDGQNHKFLQIYFLGDEEEIDARHRNHPDTDTRILEELQKILNDHNRYVREFKTALERMPSDDHKLVIHANRAPAGEHQGRYNAPAINEVAVVITNEEHGRRDIVLHRRDNRLQRISEIHPAYDALQYPLILWRGEDGYHTDLKQVNPQTQLPTNKSVSCITFYAYQFMVREEPNHILMCRSLFHQYAVDMYAKAEGERLLYVKLNQSKLRAEEYIHLRDAMRNDDNPANIGRKVILPSSFTGSPRHMIEYTQDAMAYVRSYGTPDLFVTFTCNPKWQEITESLYEGQTHYDRHDIVARVFRQKVLKMVDLLTKGQLFGDMQCFMYTIEWQKRGLPHAHLLLWLKTKLRPNEVDRVICAELPNPETDPLLFQTIKENMIHGPCGSFHPKASCMENNACTKRYPKKFVQETQHGEDGYPLYRRRSPGAGGHTTTAMKKTGNGNSYVQVEIDNRWIVPYSPVLCKAFNAHINVEYCNSVKSIKYICKYINKGSDQAIYSVENDTTEFDEINRFREGRYISTNEAIWRIFDFPIHDRYPSVQKLAIHLENGQRVYFTEQNARERVENPPKTTLTAFFELCTTDDFAKTLIYSQVPKFYTWNQARHVFQRRKIGKDVPRHPGIKSSDTLGRVFTVHPSQSECFHLRILLLEVPGPTSFQYLRTVNGEICETYRAACQARGLLQNDNQWDLTMDEVAATRSPQQIRDLFLILITDCEVSEPLRLWHKYKNAMSEDYLREVRRQNPHLEINFSNDIHNMALIYIEDKSLNVNGRNLLDLGLPRANRNIDLRQRNIVQERSYDIVELGHFLTENEHKLNDDQRRAFTTIMDNLENGSGGIFYLDAPGGTGKTFVIKLILAKVRQSGKIAIAVASSGIAATLLPGGRTAHSVFRLPLDLAQRSQASCTISKNSGKAKLLKETALIVWDECTMAHAKALETVDITLKDVRDSNRAMGGILVLLAGDFRQTLPVIRRSTPADELRASLKSSSLWPLVKTLKLKLNMRAQLASEEDTSRFAAQLLQLGEGKLPMIDGLITFPPGFCQIVRNVSDLKARVFENLQDNFANHEWLCERAILAPKNDMVDSVNFEILQSFPGLAYTYRSFDSITDVSTAVNYPVEYLNSLQPSGMPPHKLLLKIGVPIMILRNLDPPRLCNGTKMCVTNLRPNTIEAKILNGAGKGDTVNIPRIVHIDEELPFKLKRVQFPVRLAFSITINKSQGQTLKVAGIDLRHDCFSHGQLYVAASRVGNPRHLIILSPDGKAKNVVYPQALRE